MCTLYVCVCIFLGGGYRGEGIDIDHLNFTCAMHNAHANDANARCLMFDVLGGSQVLISS